MLERDIPHLEDATFHDQAAVLRVTLDNMDQGLIMTDPLGRIAVCNKRAIELLNLPPALMASHPRVEEVVAYQVRHGELKGFPTNGAVQSVQEQRRPNGMVIEMRCVPLPEGGVVCTYTDVTERRDSAEQLRLARDAAERARSVAEAASRAKTDFLAAMSHEIRTPLNAIIGFSDLIAESRRLEPDLQRHADVIQSSGHALLTIVNDILDFSKVEAGKVVLCPTAFAPKVLMESCIAIVRAGAVEKALSIHLQLDPNLPTALVGDEARLRQVLLNLLNNAVKFTRHGSVTLGVSREGSSAMGEIFRFSVKDTGIGIPKDKQDRLFQLFSQVDGSIERDFGGTGLGLAICRRLVELMGGTIGVRSEAGAGAEFWFEIVLPAGKSAPSAAAAVFDETASRRGRVLLVEDIDVNQILARLILESMGHEVDVVADGEAAVAAVRDGALHDIVLMDVQMQGMDGLTATRLIRDLPGPRGRVPIVAMTANVLPEQVQAFNDAGMDDCIGKPFKRADLLATIDRWLRDRPESTASVVTHDPGAALGQQVDQATFDQLVELMGASVVAALLAKFATELESCFDLMRSYPQARIGIRRKVHDLVPAVGLLGLARLARAFTDILAFDEERVRSNGDTDYVALLQATTHLGAQTLAILLTLATGLQRMDGDAAAPQSGRA